MNVNKKYVHPSSMKKAFTCFHCDSLEKQTSAGVVKIGEHSYVEVIACEGCSELSVWKTWATDYNPEAYPPVDISDLTWEEENIYPKRKFKIEPIEEMDPDHKILFTEAAKLLYQSPRTSEALLNVIFEAILTRRFPKYTREHVMQILRRRDAKRTLGEQLFQSLQDWRIIKEEDNFFRLEFHEEEYIERLKSLFVAINKFIEFFWNSGLSVTKEFRFSQGDEYDNDEEHEIYEDDNDKEFDKFFRK